MRTAQMNTTSSEPVSLPRRTMRLAELARILLNNPEHTLYHWLPEGQLAGNEYKALNPVRNDSTIGSFSINVDSGVWADFAMGDRGSSLVDLYGYLNGITNPVQLINALTIFCKEQGLTKGKSKRVPIKTVVKSKPPTELIAADDMNWLPPDSDSAGNQVTQSWEYRTQENEVSFYVQRTEPEPGKKETKPCRLSGGKWVWSYPDGPLPLYNCHHLKAEDTVLFGEGEKTADALHSLNAGIGMTSAGGSNRLMASDLSPLKKAGKVIVFPDADVPGINYAAQVMWYCLAQGIDCQLLNSEAIGWLGGEDAADHPELTWADYEPHLLTPDAWRKAHSDAADEALFEVIGGLSQADYDRSVDRLVTLSGLSKSTLKGERKDHQKESFDGQDALPEIDVSDIDLPLAEKIARRSQLELAVKMLAHSNDILDQAVLVCHQSLGVHNEVTLIKLGYLSIVSRLLEGFGDRPVSLMLKGSSGSGKSHVIKQVLKLFRQNATWIILSSISPKGLIYDQRSYRGKVLFLPECNQLVDQDSLLTQL